MWGEGDAAVTGDSGGDAPAGGDGSSGSSGPKEKETAAPPEDGVAVAVEASVFSPSTRVEILELALPQHMNHMQHNFGGQIMSWMFKAVSVCIGRHVGAARDTLPFNIRLIAIDKLDFVLGSDTADHASELYNTLFT